MLTKRKIVSLIIATIVVTQFSITGQNIAFGRVQQSNKGVLSQASEKSTPYKITKHKYKNNGVTIYYPQISISSDNKNTEVLNKLIKTNALRGLKYYSYLDDNNPYTVDITYSIKYQSAAFLSIEYSGIGNAKGSAHPSNLYYTTNININKAAVIRLKDVVHINKKFIQLFLSNKFKPIVAGLESVKTEFGEADYLLKAISSSDYPVGATPNLDYSTFSYFNKNYLVISIGVAHVAGDHAEYRVKYGDLKDFINTQNEVWKDLTSIH